MFENNLENEIMKCHTGSNRKGKQHRSTSPFVNSPKFNLPKVVQTWVGKEVTVKRGMARKTIKGIVVILCFPGVNYTNRFYNAMFCYITRLIDKYCFPDYLAHDFLHDIGSFTSSYCAKAA